MSNFEKKNTVESKGQVRKHVFFEGSSDGIFKVLFLGNSITKHGVLPEIGWYGDWGMAASDKEKDYVHLCEKKITSIYPEASFCIVQGAEWERRYRDEDVFNLFEEAKNYNPDLIISFLSENVPDDYFEKESFIKSMHELHKYLSGNNLKTKIIVLSNFFNNEIKSNVLKEYSIKYNTSFVFISDIIANEMNLANSFEHEGVKIHPGDEGMKIIANRIMDEVNKVYRDCIKSQTKLIAGGM